jgi:putative oxidoreductase
MQNIMYPDPITHAAAVFIPRIFLGILFFVQGYDAIFRVKLKNVVSTFQQPLANRGVPNTLITAGVYITSFSELIGGGLLFLGIAKCFVLCLLGCNILLASVAFSIMKPMWDMQYVFPRLVLIIYLLVIPPQWDLLSLDVLLGMD